MRDFDTGKYGDPERLNNKDLDNPWSILEDEPYNSQPEPLEALQPMKIDSDIQESAQDRQEASSEAVTTNTEAQALIDDLNNFLDNQ